MSWKGNYCKFMEAYVGKKKEIILSHMKIWQQLVQIGLEIVEKNGGLLRPTTTLVLSSLIANNNYFDASVDSHLLTVSQVLVAGPTNWNEALDIITYGSPE